MTGRLCGFARERKRRSLDIHPTAKAGRFLRRIPSYMGRFSEVPVSMADARRSISIPARSYSASAGCHGVSRRSRNSYRYSEFAFGKCFTAGPSPANRQHSIVKDQSVPVYDCPSGTQPGRYSRIGHPQYARNRQCLTGPTVPWTYWYKATKGSRPYETNDSDYNPGCFAWTRRQQNHYSPNPSDW